mmetsp:Transcript_68995/g.189459  ORF Transcript_68995/g.189459 Transcript_68995/m.189459 type:complete len:201 (-) Transcript_68995:1719-2321(-)
MRCASWSRRHSSCSGARSSRACYGARRPEVSSRTSRCSSTEARSSPTRPHSRSSVRSSQCWSARPSGGGECAARAPTRAACPTSSIPTARPSPARGRASCRCTWPSQTASPPCSISGSTCRRSASSLTTCARTTRAARTSAASPAIRASRRCRPRSSLGTTGWCSTLCGASRRPSGCGGPSRASTSTWRGSTRAERPTMT